MITATLKINVKPKDSGKHTYNGHFLDKDIQYQVLSEQSRVMGFPLIFNVAVIIIPSSNSNGAEWGV